MLSKLLPSIMGWLVVIIILALSPTIVTYNTQVATNVAAANQSAYMIGMTAIQPFGGFIMIMGLLISGGFFAVAGMRNRNTTVKDMIEVIGAVILTVVTLALFSGTVINYINLLICAGTANSFERTAYGILAVICYVGIIGAASAFTAVKAWKSSKGKKAKASSGGFY